MKKETVLSVLIQVRDKLDKLVCPPISVSTVALRSKDGHFTRNADGTVTDNLLNLTWYPTLERKLTWEEAKKECEKLGCRLPTRKELESLLDLSKHSPAIDAEIFPDTKTDDYYWTGDTCAWGSGFAWVVGVGSGSVGSFDKGSSNYVRPVRASQP